MAYEYETLAELAIEELRAFIDTETHFIQQEHSLLTKLLSWDYIILHLDERVPSNLRNLHGLNKRIAQKLIEIRDLVESGRLAELRVIKEEQAVLDRLQHDVHLRDWRAVRKDIDAETGKEMGALRLRRSELRGISSKFREVAALMKRSNLLAALTQDSVPPQEKEAYLKVEEYYFGQLYKFALAYEAIFRRLWEKELLLTKQTMAQAQRIRS